MVERGGFWESIDEIPEPHAFTVHVRFDGGGAVREHEFRYEEDEHHQHGATDRDNNMRAAVIHVLADAAVSVLVIVGLLLARAFAWPWMDPLVGIIGAFVIATWSYGLVRDTGAILLDMIPDQDMERGIRQAIESDHGDRLTDLHLWRLGPGHIGAIVSVATKERRGPTFYHQRLARFRSLSHVTVEVEQV